MVRSRGIEPPRAKLTATSTLRVYHFRHDRKDFRGSLASDMAIGSPPGKRERGPAALANLSRGCKVGLG